MDIIYSGKKPWGKCCKSPVIPGSAKNTFFAIYPLLVKIYGKIYKTKRDLLNFVLEPTKKFVIFNKFHPVKKKKKKTGKLYERVSDQVYCYYLSWLHW